MGIARRKSAACSPSVCPLATFESGRPTSCYGKPMESFIHSPKGMQLTFLYDFMESLLKHPTQGILRLVNHIANAGHQQLKLTRKLQYWQIKNDYRLAYETSCKPEQRIQVQRVGRPLGNTIIFHALSSRFDKQTPSSVAMSCELSIFRVQVRRIIWTLW